MKSDNIVIVGGGSSGWMAAAFLIKTFPEKNISLIESKDVPIIGVGESTLGDMANYRDYLGLDNKEFMKSTDASYKMSIKFTDFYKKDSGSFHYPFGIPDLEGTQIGLLEWFEIKGYYPDTPVEDFTRCFFPHSFLYENNKISENKNGEFGNFSLNYDVAYHFDATAFGHWLKTKYCIPRGVNHLEAKVVDSSINENGIEYLILDNGEKIFADLFIDCTGFHSLLISQYLKEPFESIENILPNNRAWATRIPYIEKEKELEPFTNCTAIENGWCWNIPLWSRLGAGYVYSDNHISPEDALKQFKKYLMSNKMILPRNKKQVDQLEFKDIKMKVGIHKRTWVKNVIALGLSAGFIEPLESNGLFTIQRFLLYLGKSLLREKISQLDIDIYNNVTKTMFYSFSEFVAQHYALSLRDDTQYWKDIRSKTYSESICNLYPTLIRGFVDTKERKMNIRTVDNIEGITYISTGMNYPFFDRINQEYSSFGYKTYGDVKEYIDSRINFFNNRKLIWHNASLNKPTLYQYLKENIYD